jgi:repressor LexA
MPDERPSKKQHEVFTYIAGFIQDNGFGPSYREVQRALGLKSVSTVATHVNGLIAKGFLVKRENSARSLQVVQKGNEAASVLPESAHLVWLRHEIARREADEGLSKEAAVLKAALEVLGKSED